MPNVQELLYRFCENINQLMPHNVIPKMMEGGEASLYVKKVIKKDAVAHVSGNRIVFKIKPKGSIIIIPTRKAKFYRRVFLSGNRSPWRRIPNSFYTYGMRSGAGPYRTTPRSIYEFK